MKRGTPISVSKRREWVLSILFQVTFVHIGLAAVVINVDFAPGGSGGGDSVGYSGQGAYSDPGNNYWNHRDPSTDGSFNGVAGTGGRLDSADPYNAGFFNDSTGAGTGYWMELWQGDPEGGFAVNSGHGTYANVATDAQDLMSDYLISSTDWGAGTPALNLNGLNSSKYYTLYLYGAGDLDFRNTSFTVGGYGTQTTTGVPGGSHTLTLGQDYVVFSGITGVGFLPISWEDGGESTEGPFNGFQLIENDEPPPGGAVPEPSTAMLIGMGGFVAWTSARRRARRHI
ncbi:MAG: PEP-CTERM sorting domain-containing protein [Verrucomicrobia bacterium]|nr:PEP-CTERM sorting domain-containing protein [Verrucomicrobiota bacterium]